MKNKFIRTILGLFVAVNLAGFGAAIMVQSGLGSDPITVFIDGLHHTLGISLGWGSRMYSVITLLIAFMIARKDIGWTTIIFTLSVGFTIDFYDLLLKNFPIADVAFGYRLLCVCLGQVCLGVAYAILILFRNGMNQLEAISYYVSDKLNTKFVYVRTTFDVIFLIIGKLLGGIVGIGSIIAMCTTGFIVNMILKIMHYE